MEVGVRTDGSPAGLEEWEVDDVSVAARLLMERAAVSYVRAYKEVSWCLQMRARWWLTELDV